MTAPLLSTRDALAKALRDLNAQGWEVRADHDPGCPGGGDYCAAHCPVPIQEPLGPDQLTGALLASGAVQTPAAYAATLADDVALIEAVAADQKEAADSWGDPLPGAELSMRARTALRALTKALTERGTP